MKSKILKCIKCGQYTISNKCPNCNSTELRTPHPLKFSPNDKYNMVKYYSIVQRKGIKIKINQKI
ncbi:MAG: nucleolar RNA-binding Nop10p family protein [Thermoprotei archaeon]